MSVVTWEQILGGMITGLASITVPQGGAASSTQYLRVCDHYLGQFESEEAFTQGGLAGRTPAVLVAFAGETSLHSSVSHKSDHVEGNFIAFCASDSHRSREDRDVIFKVMRDVRQLLGAKRLGLAISPLRYRGIIIVSEKPQLFAWGVKFSTRYHLDLSRAPAQDETLAALVGDVTNTDQPPKTIGQIDTEGT